MGDEDINIPYVRSSRILIRRAIPYHTCSVDAVNVGRRNHIRLCLWLPPYFSSYSHRCLSSLLRQLPLLPQDPSMRCV